MRYVEEELLRLEPLELVKSRFQFPFEPKDFQKDTLNQFGKQTRHGYGWKPGCVDADTEFLSQRGWKRISEYQPGDMVTQWDLEDNCEELVWPSAYHTPLETQAIAIQADGVDQLLTLDHMVAMHGHTPNNPLCKVSAERLLEWHDAKPLLRGHTLSWERQTKNVYLPTLEGGKVACVQIEQGSGKIRLVNLPEKQHFFCFTVQSGLLVLRRNGKVFITGNCGKTFGTVLHANYLLSIREATQWIVLMPPIVLRNWSRFLEKVIDTKTGKPVTQTLWAGTPKKRAQLSLDNQFILMSYDIFKRDFDRIEAHFDGRRVGLISDEAHKIKNMDTVNYRAVWRMFHDRPVLLATGTPVTKPDDCYTYMKFTNPGAYRNKRHFENMHVGERDEYEKVTEWVNLDELSKNFKVNWTFVEPPPTDPINFIPLVYDLAPAHLKLYNELVETQLLELDDGRVIDALNASALYHKCQQIVCNWAHFSGDPDNVGASFELVENVLDEIGDEKLVVVANYRMTTAALFEFLGRQGYHPAKVIGGMSDKQRYAEIDRFIQDPRCRVIILQPEAGGVGLDGLQHVCSEMLFLECPVVPRQFEQAYARLDREGKRRRVNCRIAVAERTIQVRLHRTLLANDELIVKAVGGVRTLREAIHGE